MHTLINEIDENYNSRSTVVIICMLKGSWLRDGSSYQVVTVDSCNPLLCFYMYSCCIVSLCCGQTSVLFTQFIEAIVVLVRQTSHLRVTRALRPIFLVDCRYCGAVRR